MATASSSSSDPGACAASLVRSQEINAGYKTDLNNMKQDSGGNTVTFLNTTIIPMDISVPGIIERGTVVPQDGGSILPDFIDVHGHMGGFLSQHPSIGWELESFLGYSITTIPIPSSNNVRGYAERALIEKGAVNGPRIYHTGNDLYGSTQPNVYTEINSLEDARAELLHIKVEGGKYLFSAKNLQFPARSARQRLLLEVMKLDMLIMSEDG